MAQDTARTDAAVRTVVNRLRLPEGESLARRLLAAETEAVERYRPLPAAFAAVRVVRRRLGYEVPAVSAGAETLGVDPRDVAAAERTLVASLSPPAAEAERRRLDAAVRAARERLDGAEEAEADSDAADRARTAVPGESVAERRAHLARLEADRSMARLGFALYDIARGNDTGRDGRRPRSDADRA